MSSESSLPPSSPQNLTKTTVYVTNIAPSATEQTICDFFSFCGKINSITFTKHEDKEGEAIVIFESEAAAKTALLLTNALIIDRPILVAVYSPPASQPDRSLGLHSDGSLTTELKQDQIKNPNPVPAEERTKTSVIASLLAAGYKLSNDAIAKAREFDEQNRISEKVMQAAEVVVDKMKELDIQYKITEKVESLVEKAKEVDSRYGITNTLTENFETLQKKARENPKINDVVTTISQWGEDLGNRVKAEVEEITQQSKTLIEQQQKQENSAGPTGHAAGSTSQAARSDVSRTNEKTEEETEELLHPFQQQQQQEQQEQQPLLH